MDYHINRFDFMPIRRGRQLCQNHIIMGNIDKLVISGFIEMMMMIGDSAGIEYDKGLDDPKKGEIRDSLFAKLITKYEKKVKSADLESPSKEVVEDTEVEEVEKPSGLMARRT